MEKDENNKKILEQHEGEVLTTRFIMEDLGITSYYITKFTNEGILEKVSRGIYRVPTLTNPNEFNENTPNYFKNFKNLVLDEKYEKAYYALIDCVEKSNSHNYDNHCRVYFILLERILTLMGMKKILNYNYDDKLLEFYDAPRTEYYESYVNFREAVLANKYTEAYGCLKVYADKEEARYKKNRISTILSQKLLGSVVKLESDKKELLLKINQIFKLDYERNYEELKRTLEETVPLLYLPPMKPLCECLIDLCQTIIDFKNDENLILSPKKSYNLPKEISIGRAFLKFMKNKDYLSAAEYVEKYCELYKENSFTNVVRHMLKHLIHLDNNHRVKSKSKIEIQEIRTKDKKNDANAKPHFSNALRALQKLDFNTAYKEVEIYLSYISNTSSPYYKKNKNLYLMLKFLKDMEENKTVLNRGSSVHYFKGDYDAYNLNLAIAFADWESAQLYLQKIGAQSSLILEAYDLVLKAIIRQDKINRGIALSEEDELTPLSSHLNINRDKSEKDDEPIKGTPTCNVFDVYEKVRENEILEGIKNLKLNYKTLYNLIKAREFDEAAALIAREEANGYSIESLEEEKEVSPEMQDTPKTEIDEVVDEVLTPIEDSTAEASLEEFEKTEENPIEEEKKKDTSELVIDGEPLSEEEQHKAEVLESIKDMELNYDNLYDLVYDRKYEEVLYLFEKNNYTEGLAMSIRNLITQYQKINAGIINEVEQKSIDFSQTVFQIFFAALKNRDYNLALEYVDGCIDLAYENKNEFVLLKLILQDIVPVYNQVREKEEILERVADINNELKEMSYKKEFSSADVKKVLALLEEKIDIAKEYKISYEKDILVLGVAEAAVMADNHSLNICCFARIILDNNYSVKASIDKKEIGEVFYNALKYGDLVTAYNIIVSKNWDNLYGYLIPSNFRLVKYLLEFINERTPLRKISEKELEIKREKIRKEKVSDDKQEQIDNTLYAIASEEDKANYRHIDFLRYLDSAIESDHFADALEKLLVVDDSFNDPEVIANALIAHSVVKEESQALFNQFVKAEKSHNIEETLKALKNYKAYVNQVSADYNTGYLDKRINILTKDLGMKIYPKKEKLFESARNLFNKGQYEKSLKEINTYIAMDRYVNNKGFILKGDIYYEMGDYEHAKEAYLKALTVAQDPGVCQKLGNMYFREEEYEKAIYYLELYTHMNPFMDISVSRMLITCYNSIGETEQAKKYDQRLRHLAYLKSDK